MAKGVRHRHRNRSPSVGDYVQEESYEKLEAQASQGWNVFSLAFFIATVLMGIILALLPCPIDPVSFSLPPPPSWTGPLEPNQKLTEAERVFENQLIGPESVVKDGEYIYTGTVDGRIVSIFKGEITTLTRLGVGENCGSFEAEPLCGRPLGMRLDKEGYLIVADAYLGIFRVNVATGSAQHLLTSQEPMAGTLPKFLNDVEIGDDGTIYFTDSSTRWDRRHNRYCILEADTTGRVLSFNPSTRTVQELASGLAFANGLSLTSDRKYLLIAETARARILRYHLTGPEQGTIDVFADNLPGIPDNIRRSGRGTYWVGMAGVRQAEKFSFIDFAAPRPWLRSLVAKLFSQETIMSFLPKYGLLIELNKEGKIIRSLHDPTGQQVPSVSEADEKDGVLYLGSYYLPFLSRVYLYK